MTEINCSKRILIVSTVSRQFYLFEQVNISVLKELGWEIHCAANFTDASTALDNLPIIRHHIPFIRSPFSIKNLVAIVNLIILIKKTKINLIHCHTPVGGFASRIASIFTRTELIYTAHGFHFFKGSPIINWLLYYPIEYFLSYFTNIIITINHEDFSLASRFFAKRVVYIPGIGLNINKFNAEFNKLENELFRKSNSIPENATIFLSIGELIKRKNFESSIIAFSKMDNKNSHYVICGIGRLKDDLNILVKNLNIGERVHFFGFRKDIPEIIRNCDVFVFPSFQEGLPVSLMEAMACGLPVVCSAIRGNTDLIQNGFGGYLASPRDINSLVKAMDSFSSNKELRISMGKYNKSKIYEFSDEVVKLKMKEIYCSFKS